MFTFPFKEKQMSSTKEESGPEDDKSRWKYNQLPTQGSHTGRN